MLHSIPFALRAGAGALLLQFCLPSALAAATPPADSWPTWRGPRLTGVAPEAAPPLEWDDNTRIKWKAPVPGSGTSTPIVWGDQVFLLSAEPVPGGAAEGGSRPKHRFMVLSFDRATGKTNWTTTVTEAVPHEGHHQDHGYASGSPVTDGERLIAFFGSRGLHCLDLKGGIKWSKELGQMRTRNSFGEGASPALFGNTVVVPWDDETDKDFIAAFDRETGRELWRTPRSEATGWATPLVVVHGGKPQVILNATQRVRSYDLASGAELWQAGGQTANTIPTPVATADTVFVTSGFRGSAVQAIALGKTGDLTGTDAIRWARDKNTPYVPSPLLAGDCLYLVTGNNGVITCLDARTGAPHYEAQRLEGVTGIYASPVAAGDRVYVLGRNGLCMVLRAGPKFEVLARNQVSDRTDASLALVGKQIFLRGRKHLYCIE